MKRSAYSGGKGFTLIELLVVISVMIGVMAMGSMAMGDFFGQGSFRLGVRAVANSIHAARQTAIGERMWVFMEAVDTSLNKYPGDTGRPDYIRLFIMPPTVDVTGSLAYKLPDGAIPFETIELPRNIELEVLPDASGAAWAKWNLDGLQGAIFFPDGSCLPSDEDNKFVIRVLDALSRDRAIIFIYTVTSFFRVKYELED